uniref:Uncharacterized protein n=1 Tax=Vitis vinifera TaxID=29760 RepID=A5C1K0_VITVI|nr:hypothetical protein VITISV_028968 [Vitis vinifera]
MDGDQLPYQVLAQVIEDSDGGGADVASTTGGASGVVGGAEDVTSGVGTIGDAAEAGGMIFVGLLEVQHKLSNDPICRELIALDKGGGAQAEAQKDSPNALISDKAAWEKAIDGMNSLRLWKTRATLGRQLRPLDAMNISKQWLT